jgi:hypothetical protein
MNYVLPSTLTNLAKEMYKKHKFQNSSSTSLTFTEKQSSIPLINVENMDEKRSTESESSRDSIINQDLSSILTKRDKRGKAIEERRIMNELHILRKESHALLNKRSLLY